MKSQKIQKSLYELLVAHSFKIIQCIGTKLTILKLINNKKDNQYNIQNSCMLVQQNCLYPINSMPIIIFDAIFFVYLIPFIVAGLYYASHETNVCLTTTYPNLDVPFFTWLRLDSWVLIGFAISAILSIFQLCFCIATYCSYVMWLISKILYVLWRLAWLIVGAVMFWKNINPNNICGNAISRYMWANLIIGFVQVLVTLIFIIVYRPQPYTIPHPTIIPMATPTGLPIRSQFPGSGVPIGSSQIMF